jgi:hypothetical protein
MFIGLFLKHFIGVDVSGKLGKKMKQIGQTVFAGIKI